MSKTDLSSFLRGLTRGMAADAWAELSDQDLLARAIAAREEAVFEAIVRRHGPMVHRVCWRVLQHDQETEDAFQATFLVLAQRMRSVRQFASLASWLHRVAHRIALRASMRAAARCRHEREATELQPKTPADGAEVGLFAALDAELATLPEKWRLPLVLCYLEGRTQDEAARQLKWSKSTLRRRLEDARDALAHRLRRRGVVGATALSGVLVSDCVTRAMPPFLLRSTVEAMARVVLGNALSAAAPAPVTALTEGLLKTMLLYRSKLMVALLLVVAGGTVGAFAWAGRQPSPAAPPPATVDISTEARRFADPESGPLPVGVLARIGSMRLRHVGEVTGLACSPDGRWLASVSSDPRDATARVWDAETGLERFKVPLVLDNGNKLPPIQMPRAIDFSPDAKQLLVVDTVSLQAVDIATGKEAFVQHFGTAVPPLPPGDASLSGAAISPDGKVFVLVRTTLPKVGATVEVREVRTGKVLRAIEHPFGNFLSVPVAFSRDGRRFTLGGAPEMGVPSVYDTETGELVAQVQVDGWDIVHAVLPGGDTLIGLLSKKGDPFQRAVGTVEVKTGKLLHQAAVDGATGTIAVSPDGKLIAAGNRNMPFSQLIDAATGKEVGRFHSNPSVGLLTFSSDGKRLTGARRYSGAISVWDVPTRRLHLTAAEPVHFFGTVFSPDGRNLCVPGRDHPLVDWRTGTIVGRLADVQPDSPLGTFVSPDQQLIAVPNLDDGLIRLHHATTGAVVQELKGHTDVAPRMDFSGDGRRLASCSQDKTVRVWDVATGQQLARFDPPNLTGWEPPALSQDGRVLVVAVKGASDGSSVVHTWDVNQRAPLKQIQAPRSFSMSPVLSPDGRRVAGGGALRAKDLNHDDMEVTVWDTRSGRTLCTLPEQAGGEMGAGAVGAFSPDGRWLATGDAAGKLRLWEMASGKQVHSFEGHRTEINSIAFSPDGRQLVAASEDAPCFVWDVLEAGREKPIGEAEHDSVWRDLGSADGAIAFRAIRRLRATPAAVAALGGRLQAAPRIDPARVEKLIRELDDEQFATREAAQVELKKLANQIEPALNAALAKSPSAEARRRLEALLDSVVRSPEQVRDMRVIAALEYAGTPEAARLLEGLAAGAKGDPLTKEAAEALGRLQRRAK
jgi:RNA polymerase sigma factor (sigma-70 family)